MIIIEPALLSQWVIITPKFSQLKNANNANTACSDLSLNLIERMAFILYKPVTRRPRSIV